MHYPRVHRPVSFLHKCLGAVLFMILAVIGIAGLILPVIPGLVFLLLAVYVLTRVSRRVAHYAHRQPWYTGSLDSMQRMSTLSLGERAKLCALLAARSVLQAAQWLEIRLRRQHPEKAGGLTPLLRNGTPDTRSCRAAP